MLNIQSSWKGAYNWFVGGTTTNLSSARTFTVPTNTAGTYRYVVKDFSANTCLKDSFEVVVSLTLPVALNSFTANLQNKKVVLDWATSIEENNKYFTLEKSIDGINFSFLSKVDGAGNSSTIKNYKAFDLAPVNGNNYYRLSQTNADGKVSYFEVKKISYKSNTHFNASVSNTANGFVVNIHSIRNDNIKVNVYDAGGREILKDAIAVTAGLNNKPFVLRQGVYIVRLSNSTNEIITNKVIIQ